MNSAEQVLFVLQLILVLGPLAVYFLGLGLVNSLARPCLVNARVDFVLLSVAFVPVILVPLITMLQHGHTLAAVVILVLIGGAFYAMLPERRTRWVIYNSSVQQCRRLLDRAARREGWSVAASDDQIRLGPVGLTIQVTALPWLRNVTLTFAEDESATPRFLDALQQEMFSEAMLPSPAGASLVVIGAALLGVPMWYFLHHINAIVDVVRQILFA